MAKDLVLERLSKAISEEPYAQIFQFKLEELKPGYAVVKMEINKRYLNSLGIIHGGAIFSLMDEAFQAASNSHGTIAVALSLSVTYFKAPKPGDTITAEAREINLTRKTGTYLIEVRDTENGLLANCQAIVYRKERPLPFFDVR